MLSHLNREDMHHDLARLLEHLQWVRPNGTSHVSHDFALAHAIRAWMHGERKSNNSHFQKPKYHLKHGKLSTHTTYISHAFKGLEFR